jgi:hypothetical protein
MNEYLLLKFAHIVAFVYWLGGDLGTFLASRQVVNRDLSPESRAVALKIMLACDMGPKFAMPLILPLGVHLAWLGGVLALPGSAVALVWLAALYWFCVVLILFLKEGQPFTARLSQLDLYFRIAVVAILAAYAIYALSAAGGTASWVAWKLVVFAALVSCGIAIRIRLRPFGAAFGQMMSTGPTEESDNTLERCVGRCRPYVWCIWGGLFLNAAIGTHLVG